MNKIAIIGAGISGLSLAHLMKDIADITLFEKSHGSSGRMSTRRAELFSFDHGAQYFTARTHEFKQFIQPLIAQGIIQTWSANYCQFNENKLTKQMNWKDDEPRYVGVPAMNAVTKYLANDLNIQLNTRITHVNHEKKWRLIDEKNNTYDEFDWVICTTPSHQAISLLPTQFSFYQDIESIEMTPCYSLMLGFNAPLSLDFDAAHVKQADISWIAVNNHKPGRSAFPTLVVHSSNEYAQQHLTSDVQEIEKHMLNETSRIIGMDLSKACYKTLHRWNYANNADHHQQNPVFLEKKMQLAACGDWTQGGRVEGGFTSSFLLAQQLRPLLETT